MLLYYRQFQISGGYHVTYIYTKVYKNRTEDQSYDDLYLDLIWFDLLVLILEEHELMTEETGAPQQPRRNLQRTDTKPHHATTEYPVRNSAWKRNR